MTAPRVLAAVRDWRPTRVQMALSALGLVLLVALLLFAGSDALRAFRSMSPAWTVLVLAVTLVLTGITAYRWRALTAALAEGEPTGFGGYYAALMVGRATGLVIPPSAGDFFARPLIHRLLGEGTVSAGLAAVTVERLLDGTLLLAFGPPALAYLLGHVSAETVISLFAVVAALWIGMVLALAGPVARVLGHWVGRLTAVAEQRRPRLLSALNRVLGMLQGLDAATRSPRLLFAVAGMTLIRYMFINLQFLVVARSLSLPSIGVVEVLVAVPAAQVASLLAVTPGAVGFIEGGFWGAFALLGIPRSETLGFIVGQRLLLGAMVVLLASISMLVLAWRERNRGTVTGTEGDLG